MKKKLTLITALALVVVMAVGGTLAYFTDTDAQTNVFTVGNVSIDLYEDFSDGSGMENLVPGVPVKKEIFVKNTGSEPAYIRVHIAIPTAMYNLIEWDKVDENAAPAVTGEYYTTTIDGIDYTVEVITYHDIVTAGAVADKVRTDIYLRSDVTNEDVTNAKAVLGENWKIYVVAEGGQVGGFTDAFTALDTQFGEISTDYDPGFGGEPEGERYVNGVSSAPATDEELEGALDGEAEILNITLTNNMTINVSDAYVAYGGEDTKTITIDGQGHTLTLDTTYWSRINTVNPDATLILKNMTITSTQTEGTWNSYDVTFMCNTVLENVTFNKSVAIDGDRRSVNVVMNNVTIEETNDYYALWIVAGNTVSLNDCTITSAGRGIKISDQYVDDPSMTVLNVSNTSFDTDVKAAILVGSEGGATINLSEVDIASVADDTAHAVWVDSNYTDYSALVTVAGGTVINET